MPRLTKRGENEIIMNTSPAAAGGAGFRNGEGNRMKKRNKLPLRLRLLTGFLSVILVLSLFHLVS